MKIAIKILFICLSLFFLAYLALPNPDFPKSPPDSVQSMEPADTENALRRAYFTNYDRQQVLEWYKSEFKGYLLNYPPEDAQTIIRDQTRSTFLQEVVHPFRESVYINGFEPPDPKDAININGTPWRQKITVRFVPSSFYIRITIAIFVIALVFFLVKEWYVTVSEYKNIKLWKK